MAKPSWPRIRKTLQHLDPPELLGLVKELFDLNKANQAFLAQRFDSEATENPLGQSTRKTIDRAFYVERGFPTFKAGPARKALREYQKTATPAEAIEMGLYYVARGIQGTQAYGDIDEPFYNSIESVFEETLKRIEQTPDPEAYLDRLSRVVRTSEGIGWGFHDTLVELLDEFVAKVNK